MLDMLMQQYMNPPPPNVPQQRTLDMTGLGPDPADFPTEPGLQGYYDFLMTPRTHRQASQHGSFTHYGPSRRATISDEDRESANLIMEQMRNEEQYNLISDRQKRADEIMTGRGPGAGGTMSMGDKTMQIKPKGPMTSPERMGAMAGDIPADPIQEAQIRASARGNMTSAGELAYQKAAAKAGQDALEMKSKIMEGMQLDPELDPYREMGFEGLVKEFQAGKLPSGVVRLIGPHIERYLAYKASEESSLASLATVQRLGGNEVQGVDAYLADDGQINPVG